MGRARRISRHAAHFLKGCAILADIDCVGLRIHIRAFSAGFRMVNINCADHLHRTQIQRDLMRCTSRRTPFLRHITVYCKLRCLILIDICVRFRTGSLRKKYKPLRRVIGHDDITFLRNLRGSRRIFRRDRYIVDTLFRIGDGHLLALRALRIRSRDRPGHFFCVLGTETAKGHRLARCNQCHICRKSRLRQTVVRPLHHNFRPTAFFQQCIHRYYRKDRLVRLIRTRQSINIEACGVRHPDQRLRLILIDPVYFIVIRLCVRIPCQPYTCIHAVLIKLAVQHLHIAHGSILFLTCLRHRDITESKLQSVHIYIRPQAVGNLPNRLSGYCRRIVGDRSPLFLRLLVAFQYRLAAVIRSQHRIHRDLSASRLDRGGKRHLFRCRKPSAVQPDHRLRTRLHGTPQDQAGTAVPRIAHIQIRRQIVAFTVLYDIAVSRQNIGNTPVIPIQLADQFSVLIEAVSVSCREIRHKRKTRNCRTLHHVRRNASPLRIIRRYRLRRRIPLSIHPQLVLLFPEVLDHLRGEISPARTVKPQ